MQDVKKLHFAEPVISIVEVKSKMKDAGLYRLGIPRKSKSTNCDPRFPFLKEHRKEERM